MARPPGTNTALRALKSNMLGISDQKKTDAIYLRMKNHLLPQDISIFVDTKVDLDPQALEYAVVDWKWTRSQTPPIIKFLNELLERPILGTYVKCLMLDLDEASYSNLEFGAQISRHGLKMRDAERAIWATGVTFAAQWASDLSLGKMDALLCLVLSRLPNLTKLTLGPCCSSPSGLLGQFFSSAFCERGTRGLPTYSSLLELNYLVQPYNQAGASKRERNTPVALSFFDIPKLKTLKLGPDSPRLLQWPSRRPVLHFLTFLRLSYVRETHLEDLLSRLVALKQFYWDFYFSDWEKESQKDVPVIRLDTLGKALLTVSKTLEEFRLAADTDEGSGVELPTMRFEGDLRDLNKLPKLKTLSAPLTFLIGWGPDAHIRLVNIVPKHLSMMNISDELLGHEQYGWEGHRMFNAVQLWLDFLRSTHPDLQSLSLSCEDGNYDWASDYVREFRASCVRQKLEGKLWKRVQTDNFKWRQVEVTYGKKGKLSPKCSAQGCVGQHSWKNDQIRCSASTNIIDTEKIDPATKWGGIWTEW